MNNYIMGNTNTRDERVSIVDRHDEKTIAIEKGLSASQMVTQITLIIIVCALSVVLIKIAVEKCVRKIVKAVKKEATVESVV